MFFERCVVHHHHHHHRHHHHNHVLRDDVAGETNYKIKKEDGRNEIRQEMKETFKQRHNKISHQHSCYCCCPEVISRQRKRFHQRDKESRVE